MEEESPLSYDMLFETAAELQQSVQQLSSQILDLQGN